MARKHALQKNEKGKEKKLVTRMSQIVTLLSHSTTVYHQTSTFFFPVLGNEVIGFDPSQLIITFHQYYAKY